MTHISRPQGQRIIPRLLNRFTDLEEILKCVRCKKPLALKYIFIVNNSQCGCIQWHTVTHTLICARILHQDRNSLRNRRQKSCGSRGRCLPHFHNVEEFLLGSQYFQGLNIGPVLIFRHTVQFQLDGPPAWAHGSDSLPITQSGPPTVWAVSSRFPVSVLPSFKRRRRKSRLS